MFLTEPKIQFISQNGNYKVVFWWFSRNAQKLKLIQLAIEITEK